MQRGQGGSERGRRRALPGLTLALGFAAAAALSSTPAHAAQPMANAASLQATANTAQPMANTAHAASLQATANTAQPMANTASPHFAASAVQTANAANAVHANTASPHVVLAANAVHASATAPPASVVTPPPSPVATPAATSPIKLVVLPPRDANAGAAAARGEAALLGALATLPSLQVVNLAAGKLVGPRREGRADTPAARALTLARDSGVGRALVAEASPLGDSLVLYLQALEAPGGRALGSTAVTLGNDAAADRDRLRAALVRLVDPARYLGRLDVKLDVAGAELQIDGRRVDAHRGLIELAVGTHALRATHPAYRDFLRFLDVPFDRTVPLAIDLSAYPLAEGEMIDRRRPRGATSKRHTPWYRQWWAITTLGAVLTGVTVGAIYLARPGLHDDRTVPYTPTPGP